MNFMGGARHRAKTRKRIGKRAKQRIFFQDQKRKRLARGLPPQTHTERSSHEISKSKTTRQMTYRSNRPAFTPFRSKADPFDQRRSRTTDENFFVAQHLGSHRVVSRDPNRQPVRFIEEYNDVSREVQDDSDEGSYDDLKQIGPLRRDGGGLLNLETRDEWHKKFGNKFSSEASHQNVVGSNTSRASQNASVELTELCHIDENSNREPVRLIVRDYESAATEKSTYLRRDATPPAHLRLDRGSETLFSISQRLRELSHAPIDPHRVKELDAIIRRLQGSLSSRTPRTLDPSSRERIVLDLIRRAERTRKIASTFETKKNVVGTCDSDKTKSECAFESYTSTEKNLSSDVAASPLSQLSESRAFVVDRYSDLLTNSIAHKYLQSRASSTKTAKTAEVSLLSLSQKVSNSDDDGEFSEETGIAADGPIYVPDLHKSIRTKTKVEHRSKSCEQSEMIRKAARKWVAVWSSPDGSVSKDALNLASQVFATTGYVLGHIAKCTAKNDVVRPNEEEESSPSLAIHDAGSAMDVAETEGQCNRATAK